MAAFTVAILLDRNEAQERTFAHAPTGICCRRSRNVRSQMPSQAEQATLNLEEARELRATGHSYRQIGRQLRITSSQLSHIRRALKREKAARTRLAKTNPTATDRDLPVQQSVLPRGLRQCLVSSGLRTLGDLSDRLADPLLPGFESIPGVGPHRARLIAGLLDQFGLLPGPDNLQKAVEHLFPEFAAD